MTPEQFIKCLDILGISMRKLSEILGTHNTTVQRWSKGKQLIPNNLAEWLEAQAKFRLEHPLPKGWEENRVPPQEEL
ncbi:hypothetical protein [Acetobacter oryzifermentans]|uniref:hypothetical protein n=2 Tax=Acetobacter oryzifermentans TaxID=1633874 RepID=UPI0012FF4A84|nr:hypothetical protein [Acetobacter oryzifermentans]